MQQCTPPNPRDETILSDTCTRMHNYYVVGHMLYKCLQLYNNLNALVKINILKQ